MKYKLFSLLVSILLFLASASSASACWISKYQPEVPEALRK